MDERYRKQGFCLLNNKNPQYMLTFDHLSPSDRQYIRDCSYDLCIACLGELAHTMSGDLKAAADSMVWQIRCEEIKP